jgi:hypothetical protein
MISTLPSLNLFIESNYKTEVAYSALSKNPAAFECIYDKYAGAFYGEIKRSLYNEEVSQKVLAEVFISLYNSLEYFDPSKERLFIWALKIARKKIRQTKVDLVLKQIFCPKLQKQQATVTV